MSASLAKRNSCRLSSRRQLPCAHRAGPTRRSPRTGTRPVRATRRSSPSVPPAGARRAPLPRPTRCERFRSPQSSPRDRAGRAWRRVRSTGIVSSLPQSRSTKMLPASETATTVIVRADRRPASSPAGCEAAWIRALRELIDHLIYFEPAGWRRHGDRPPDCWAASARSDFIGGDTRPA